MSTQTHLFNNAKRSISIYWHIAKYGLLGYVIFAALQVGLVLLQTFLLGRIINDLVRAVTTKSSDLHPFIFDVGALIFASISETLCWAFLSFFERQSYHRWSRHNFYTFLAKTSQLTLGQYENKALRQRLNAVVQDGYAWKPANFAQELLYAFHSSLRLIVNFAALATLLPILVPILILASIPTLLVEKASAKVQWGIWGAKGDQAQSFWAIAGLLHNKDSVLEITPQGSRAYLLKKADTAIGVFFNAQLAVIRNFLWRILSTRIFEGLVAGGVNVYLIVKVVHSKGAFSVGQYSIYASIIQQFQTSVSLIYSNLVSLLDLNQYMENYYAFLDSPTDIPLAVHPVKLSPNVALRIVFDDVSFKYPEGKNYIFKHLSLTINSGDHIAIVGENGAGKSTLIKLLMRFYDASEGSITINGHDIRTLDLPSWYEHIGVLFQDFNHYPLTLNENISIGRVSKPTSGPLIAKALRLAGITQLPATLEYGNDTILDPSFEKSADLSGGQWQKVALARAFYRDATILVLDEPTSAVDANAESEIFDQIRKKQKAKTTIIVSHRFSTVRQADRILVVQDGQIAQDGSHEELMASRGLYKTMFDKQAAGYK
jgi:ATP-binding cassette subfamily B protein